MLGSPGHGTGTLAVPFASSSCEKAEGGREAPRVFVSWSFPSQGKFTVAEQVAGVFFLPAHSVFMS